MMKFSEDTARWLRCSVLSVVLTFSAPGLFEGGKTPGGATDDTFADRNLTCVIVLGDDMRGSHGLESGFCYELLEKFAQDNRCSVNRIVEGKGAHRWIDSLRNGHIDILILHPEAHYGNEDINFSHRITPCSSWATAGENVDEIRQINNWISHTRSSEEYLGLRDRYFRTYDPHKRAGRGEVSDMASPYDGLIKQYASELGWDWRMLAAVVYQESKFSISSRSHRGARGLMQVMPNTAEYYRVTDLADPAQNLLAGTSHLKRLQKMFGRCGMDEAELIKFTLAAYNAGEGRVMDCRNFAASRQVDTNTWNEVAGLIPLMREDSILDDEAVRLGKFNGSETIEYVDSVLSYYEAICKVCPQI